MWCWLAKFINVRSLPVLLVYLIYVTLADVDDGGVHAGDDEHAHAVPVGKPCAHLEPAERWQFHFERRLGLGDLARTYKHL